MTAISNACRVTKDCTDHNNLHYLLYTFVEVTRDFWGQLFRKLEKVMKWKLSYDSSTSSVYFLTHISHYSAFFAAM